MFNYVQFTALKELIVDINFATVAVQFYTVLGVLVGALITGYLARQNQKRNRQSELQNQAIADFLKATAESAFVSRGVAENERLIRLADAKARICAYGEPAVIQHCAECIRAGELGSKDGIVALIKMFLEIRKSADMAPENDQLSDDIRMILFNKS